MNQEQFDAYWKNISQRWKLMEQYVTEIQPAVIHTEFYGEPPLSEIDRQLEALDEMVRLDEIGARLHGASPKVLEHGSEVSLALRTLEDEHEFLSTIKEVCVGDAAISILRIWTRASYFDPTWRELDEILSRIFNLSPRDLGRAGFGQSERDLRPHELLVAQHEVFQDLSDRLDHHLDKRRGWFRTAIKMQARRSIRDIEIADRNWLGLTPRESNRDLLIEDREQIRALNRSAESPSGDGTGVEAEAAMAAGIDVEDRVLACIGYDRMIAKVRSHGRGIPPDQDALLSLWEQEGVPLIEGCRRLGFGRTVANALQQRMKRARASERKAASG